MARRVVITGIGLVTPIASGETRPIPVTTTLLDAIPAIRERVGSPGGSRHGRSKDF